MADLTDVATADLALLAASLASGRIEALDRAGLASLGLAGVARDLRSLVDLDASGALAVVRAVLAERQRDVPGLELVWTGPEAGLRPARDTAVALREVFDRAQTEVLVCGYSFDHGAETLGALHRAVLERGVHATLFLNVERAPKGADAAAIDRHVTRAFEHFLAQNWPAETARPDLFYDPRTVPPGSVVSLHAKCAVVDRRWALVSSANFTDRGQQRNVEVGVLIDDPQFAGRLAEQCSSLIPAGLMRRYVPSALA